MNQSSEELSPSKMSLEYSLNCCSWHSRVEFGQNYFTHKRSKGPLHCCPDKFSVSYSSIKSVKLAQQQRMFEIREPSYSSYAPSRKVEQFIGAIPALIIEQKTNQNHFFVIPADIQFHRIDNQIYKDQVAFLRSVKKQIQKRIKADQHPEVIHQPICKRSFGCCLKMLMKCMFNQGCHCEKIRQIKVIDL